MILLPKGVVFKNLADNHNGTATATFGMKADGIIGEVRVTVRGEPSADRCVEEAARGLSEFLQP